MTKIYSHSEVVSLIEEMDAMEKYWITLGGISDNSDYTHHVYGTEEILMEFMLTYDISPNIKISEIY